MTPLNLTNREPRGPRELLGGFPMLARTIDRARASLPGGALGPYVPVTFGLSAMLLDRIGITADEFLGAVARARDDDDVLQWVLDRAGHARLAETTQWLADHRVRDIPPDHRPKVEALYPADLLASCETSFDLLEADDARMAAARAKAVHA